MNGKNENQYQAICDAVEKHVGMKMVRSQDFDWLAEKILEQQHQMVSANTLKRLWGYFDHVRVETRKSVLDLLAQYLGYSNYVVFVQTLEMVAANKSSDEVNTNHLEVKKLPVGQRICVTWLPDRRVVMEHLGQGRCIIREVENSKLCVGDTFNCHLLIDGEPLFLGSLSRVGKSPSESVAYQAGKQGGIHFEVLID
jgi:hypothetical protein